MIPLEQQIEILKGLLQEAEEYAAELEQERYAWRDALQHLTPLGSEYTEPHECVRYVRGELDKKSPRRMLEAERKCELFRQRLYAISCIASRVWGDLYEDELDPEAKAILEALDGLDLSQQE